MRTSFAALLGGVLFVAPGLCLAETAVPGDGGPCVDVQVGSERVSDLDCINRQLRLKVEQQRDGVPSVAPVDARSPSNIAGTANQAAAEQKMGGAFGKSAQPQRPPAPAFVTPLALPQGAH